MENISLFNEIMVRSESLLIIVYVIFAYYAFRACSTNIEDTTINRELLQMVAFSFLFIAILLIGRTVLSLPGRPIYEIDNRCLLLGMVVQLATAPLLYAPIKIRRLNRDNSEAPSLWIYVPVITFIANILIWIIPAKYHSSAIACGFMTAVILLLLSAAGYAFIKRINGIKDRYPTGIRLLSMYGGDIILFWIAIIVTLFIIATHIFAQIEGEYMVFFILILNVLNILIAANTLFSHLRFNDEKFKNRFILTEPIFDEKDKNRELRERLLRYFESEKPYLKSDLTVNEVALYLYSNKTYISRVINDSFNLNFNQFVNRFRIEEAKRLYKENTSLSINKLCTSSGFGSIATFTISFRLFAGLSPAEWCKECKKSMGYVTKR